MKRLLIIVSLFWGCLSAGAQGGIPLLDKVEGHRVRFHYSYSLSRGGGDFNPVTEGDVCVEGNAYSLDGLGLKVISDGSIRWTLDESAREAVVEKVEKEDLFTNPALFIASYKNYGDKIVVNASGKDFLDITLVLDDDTKARFLLKDIVYGEPQGKSDFSPEQKSLSKDYVVTDLR